MMTFLRIYTQKTEILKIQDGGGRHIGFWKNAYNFRVAEAILLKFDRIMQNDDVFTNIYSKDRNYENQRWPRPPYWILNKCL